MYVPYGKCDKQSSVSIIDPEGDMWNDLSAFGYFLSPPIQSMFDLGEIDDTWLDFTRNELLLIVLFANLIVYDHSIRRYFTH